jgi:hypothetical protein
VLDLTPPTTPRIVGPHIVVAGKPFVLTIHSKDPGNVSPPIRFTCKIDSQRTRACTATLRLRLKKGKHRIGVRATDDQGNVSLLGVFSVRAR